MENVSMNRRHMLKLSSAFSVAAWTPGAAIATATAGQSASRSTVSKWEVFEITLSGPAGGNPFAEVDLHADFSLEHRTVSVDGFYDGEGRYKIRFMPDDEGNWTFSTSSNAEELNGKTGGFTCTPALASSHGPVRVRNTSHFAYEDGTPYFPFGTTCYAWVHQSEAMQEQTLRTLASAPFNKMRMCIFPKHYEYNHNEPALYPFVRDAAGKHDFSRFNPAFFAHIEKRIGDLRALGIEADLILFHPYDRWGYQSMTAEEDDRYLKYVLARLSPFSNIWWSIANEYDLMKYKSVSDFDRFFHIVERHDPYGHLRSIHYSNVMYDYSHPWVTHVCMQSYKFDVATEWRASMRKPLIWDEVGYEGNLNRRWGNLAGEEMLRRFWLAILGGGYASHGETLLKESDALDENSTPSLWWAHGGELRGVSPQRIGFLRKVVEETAGGAGVSSKRTGLTAQIAPYYLNATVVDEKSSDVRQILYYTDFHQPLFYEFPIPEGRFTAELIDPWAMKITPLGGTYEGKSKIRLTGRPYQAVRFRRV
jgi:hypothetical protein